MSAIDRVLRRHADEDYHGGHRPPENGPPLHNLLEEHPNGGKLFPDDVYTHPQYYAHGGEDNYSAETLRVIFQARGNPNLPVTIYRAAPADATHINPGDWVALAPGYAELHGAEKDKGYRDVEQRLWIEYDTPRDWPILSATVPASQIRNGGNDLIEWGYWGAPIEAEIRGGAESYPPGP